MFFFHFLVLFYFITFTPKCYALAVAAVGAEPRAILRNKICKILQIPSALAEFYIPNISHKRGVGCHYILPGPSLPFQT